MGRIFWIIRFFIVVGIAISSLCAEELNLEALQHELVRYKEVEDLRSSGQSILAERMQKEIDLKIATILKTGKKIQSPNECPFITPKRSFEEMELRQPRRKFGYSCYQGAGIKIVFSFYSSREADVYKKGVASPDALIESFEGMDSNQEFAGEIELINLIKGFPGYTLYIGHGSNDHIEIRCKLRRIKIVE